MRQVLRADHSDALDTAHAGGKGANLSKLVRTGFRVPDFFILPVAAYRDWIGQDAIGDALLRMQWTLDRPDVLDREAVHVQTQLEALPFPAAWQDLLAGGFVAGLRWAARSSGTLEDAGETAAAGLHETYLALRDLPALENAIRRCWISVWSGRAIAYRAAHRIAPESAGLAVVVQRMIDAEVAGVAFSADPVAGDLDVVTIDANFGLGESVVSGEVEVDRWRLGKRDGAVREESIGHKLRWVPPTSGHFEEMPAVQIDMACLDALQREALRDLVVMLENRFAWPQDCEWAFASGVLWLLQTRPITRMAARWTRDESAERFPNAMTRLTWSVIFGGFNRSFRNSMENILQAPFYSGPWFERIEGYVYGDTTAAALYTLHFQRKWLERLSQGIDVEPSLQALSWVHDLPQTWQRDQDVFLLEIGRLRAIDIDALDDAGVLEFLRHVRDLGEQYFLPNIAISFAQRNIYALLYGIIVGKLGRERAASVFDALLAPAETRTALVNRDAMALAAHLRHDKDLHAAVRGSDFARGVPPAITASWPKFGAAWDAFLTAHGHRETDIDLISPTWGEAPAVVRDLLLALADGSQHDDHNTQRWQKRKLAVEAQQQLLDTHDDYRYTTNEVIELARVYTVLDDVEHYQTTRLHPLFRRGALTLARRWLAQGALPCVDAIFCLDFDQLAVAVAQGPQAICAVAEREWQAYCEAKARTPRWSMDGPMDASDNGAEAADATDAGQRSGVPGSPGIVEGMIFIVRGTEDFGRMPPGAVLVARTTNPAWTPLFYRATAVITESGGQLSHGAVTARELGLPAVMSVRGVLQWLKDGDRVRVDGQRGRVQKLD